VAESLTVIRHLIQQEPDLHASTVIQLAKNLDTATNPRARATIIWLVGEFSGVDGENNIAADVLRILAKGFVDEAEPAKLQIVLLAAKVYLHYLNRSQSGVDDLTTSAPVSSRNEFSINEEGFQEFNAIRNPSDLPPQAEADHPIALLWNYILLLARYDVSYDLRDRTRLYKALLAVPSSTQLAKLMLLAPKPVPHIPSPSESRKGFMLGSASLVVGEEGGGGLHGLRGYEALPDWVEPGKEPDPKLRDVDAAQGGWDEKRVVTAGEMLDNAAKSAKIGTGHGVGQKINGNDGESAKEKTLDDWLAESDGEDEEEEGEESEEEESSEEVTESEEESDADDKEHDRLVK